MSIFQSLPLAPYLHDILYYLTLLCLEPNKFVFEHSSLRTFCSSPNSRRRVRQFFIHFSHFCCQQLTSNLFILLLATSTRQKKRNSIRLCTHLSPSSLQPFAKISSSNTSTSLRV